MPIIHGSRGTDPSGTTVATRSAATLVAMPKKKRRPRKPVHGRRPIPQSRRAASPDMSGNIIAYALEQGFDMSDPAAVDAFMHFYNGLPYEARVAISDGDWRSDVDDWLDDDELDDAMPAFLGGLPSDEALEAHLATVDEAAFFRDAPLMHRADLLLERVGEGHPFTDDDGLGRETTVALLEAFGFEPEGVTTTWDAPPVSALVAGLLGGGFLTVSDGLARRADLVVEWAGPDGPPEQRAAVGRILHATTLSAFLTPTEVGSAALAPHLTAMALITAYGPGGIDLPEEVAEPDAFEELRQDVRADLLALVDIGILERDGDRFTASPVLMHVLPAVVDDVMGGPAGVEQ